MIKLFFAFIVSIMVVLTSCSSEAIDKDHSKKNELLKCYFFFIPNCPASENNLLKLKDLEKEYKPNVEFIGVLSEPDFDRTTLDSVANRLDINFEMIIDDSLLIAQKHGATITPECFLYDSGGKLIYSGAFDDYYKTVGRHNIKVNQTYLEDALKSAKHGKPIEISKTQAVGCKINLEYFE